MKISINFLPVISLVFYIISLILLLDSNILIFSYGTSDLFFSFLILLCLMPLVEIVAPRMNPIFSGYFISIFLIGVIISIILDFTELYVLLLQIISVASGIRYILGNVRRKYYRIAYIFYGTIMFFISSLIRFDNLEHIGNILISNISNDISYSGIPLFFKYGMVIFSQRFFIFTISYQYVFIILTLGFLLMENSRKIIEISREGKNLKSEAFGLTSASFSILSCQCETTTSVVPAIGAEILGIISIPIIIESLILSLLTFIFIQIIERRGENKIFKKLWSSNPANRVGIILSVAGILFIPIFITAGTTFGLESNLFFYFGTSVGVFVISSYIFFNILGFSRFRVRQGKLTIISMVIFLLVAMVIWYVPQVLISTVKSGILFSIMGIASILAGLVFSILILSFNRYDRIIAMEYAAGMFPVIFVIVLYYSVVTESVIWPIYNLVTQEIFSLVLLGISLPFMWFITNYSIFSQHERTKENVNTLF